MMQSEMDYDVGMTDAPDSSSLHMLSAADRAAIGQAPPLEDQECDQDAVPASNKIHIRGVDTLSSDDVITFVKEHCGPVSRIEWIDDSSANLVFPSKHEARDAFLSLSEASPDMEKLAAFETIPAKAMSSKPNVQIHIRFALTSDKKRPGASARSRYYLFHPDQDHAGRIRRDRIKYRDRGSGNSHRRNVKRTPSRHVEDIETFNSDLYDDKETHAYGAGRNQNGGRPQEYDFDIRPGRADSCRNEDRELFPNRQSFRLSQPGRNRSASPQQSRTRNAKMADVRDRNMRTVGRAIASVPSQQLVKSNASKELFPAKVTSSGGKATDKPDMAAHTRLSQRTISLGGESGVGNSTTTAESVRIRGMANQEADNFEFAIKGVAGKKVTELFPEKLRANNGGRKRYANKHENMDCSKRNTDDMFSSEMSRD
ncbi:hypothetical protein SODALDRAFT_293871 [Sodiomyces alkalinus F11]|uniref:Uncharacterized protein n=1 Tax=Sodiomyces alkalinus (strain CBS 110278 / VKM F-3762 / F11) TaxID=1314773 RepID=A0A3N2Q010_SODAK|nr:hypothetical protein SODALDRAFT_293871 [Sodiomyces alkalinus F11]ROT40109.1 hypothetical protein SODALDRAFT_293871 [Sodiomyces alkalinus F11]